VEFDGGSTQLNDRAMGAKVVSRRQATIALEPARRPPSRFPAIQVRGIAGRSMNALFNM
jgi:hypothetical protein